MMPLRRLLSAIDNGDWGTEPETDDAGIRCIRAADFDFVRLKANVGSAPLRLIREDVKRRSLLRRGDLVLEKSGGGAKTPVGRAVLFDSDQEAVCSNFAARLRPAHGVDSRYLSFLLAALYYSGATERCAIQTTGIQNLDTGAWLQTEVPEIASLEQRRIADFLDDQVTRIDNIIAAREQQLRLARAEFTSVVHGAIAGMASPNSRRATALPWLDSVPQHWGEPRICQVARMGTGHTPSRSNPEYWVDCAIPWLTTGDVHKFRHDEIELLSETSILISEVGLANSSAVLHPAGTVALSRTASAGFSIIMGTDMATSQDFATWTPGAHLLAEYLLWCLRDMRPDIMGRLATGSTHKTIYFPDLMSIRIPLPPVDEQRMAVDAIIHAHQAQLGLMKTFRAVIDRLEELKRSLITAAVSGEFDVSSAVGSQIPLGSTTDVPVGTSAQPAEVSA